MFALFFCFMDINHFGSGIRKTSPKRGQSNHMKLELIFSGVNETIMLKLSIKVREPFLSFVYSPNTSNININERNFRSLSLNVSTQVCTALKDNSHLITNQLGSMLENYPMI